MRGLKRAVEPFSPLVPIVGAHTGGYFADLVLLDYGRVADSATYREPRRQPEGIEAVWVNGRPVLDHGAWAAQGAGRVLRR